MVAVAGLAVVAAAEALVVVAAVAAADAAVVVVAVGQELVRAGVVAVVAAAVFDAVAGLGWEIQLAYWAVQWEQWVSHCCW